MKGLEEKLNIARKELLDLSFRNPLINFKLRKTSGLLFKNVDYSALYEHLVIDGKTSVFTKEYSNKPNRLTVDLDESEIHRRVNKTYRNNRLFIEEKGSNSLFLAIGFLNWFEDDILYSSPLVLVPVDLKKQLGREYYVLSYNYEDVLLNTSLEEKLRTTFGVDITYEPEEFDIIRYFNFLKLHILPEWNIDCNKTALDFFSYAKYLMYKFLDYENWYKNGELINKEVFNKLFYDGFNEELSKNVDINLIETPNKFYHVVDADSTQALAIYDVNNGKSLVMQGPPGTGKSQTITNIISNSVAMGKSILFVAEKKAALDVVYGRLKRVGLSDLAIEIHSDKANKIDFLKDIEKTLSLGEPKVNDNTELFNKYEAIKKDLNQYKDIVNKELFDSKKSLVEIYGQVLKIKETLDDEQIRLPRVDFKNIESWTNIDFEKRLDLIKEFSDLLKHIQKVEKHPFYGSKLNSCLPYEQVSLKEKLIDLDDSLSILIKLANEMSSLVSNKGNNSIFECQRFIKSIEYAKNFTDVSNINIASYYFQTNGEAILSLLRKAKQIKEFEKNNEFKTYFDNDFILNYEKCYKSKEKRSVKKEAYDKLVTYVSDNNTKKQISLLYSHMCDRLLLLENESLLREIFKENYSENTNYDELINKTKKIIEMHKKINSYEIILQTKFIINDETKLEKLLHVVNDYKEALDDFVSSKELFMKSAKFDESLVFGYEKWYLDTPLVDLKRIVNNWINNIDRITEIVRYNEIINKFNKLGIYEIAEISKDFKYNFDYLAFIISFEYYDSLINRAYVKYPELIEFKKFKAERKIELFKEYDISIMIENIKEILNRHYSSMPHIGDDTPMMHTLRREFQKKRNQMPIRKLIGKCSEITKIKPVFMMSPLSVSTYLNPSDISFDLVIFDEASQVRPVEAFGPLLMAKQIVVVGDSKQLPPTTFFDTMTNKYDELTDEDYDIANMESVLSLLLSKNIRERTLRWHYRSRHQSLIALSNQEFYDSKLLLFPSSNDLDKEDGLVFKHCPKTIYNRGTTRTNPLEAKLVIEEAFKHMESNPNQTLGIASFSMAQADELYREFERQLKQKRTKQVEMFLDESKSEPFFIKNLENVQGDERDVILISIGYGIDQNGNLSMDFGPLNKDGGERRLNVLITRARRKCIVFSNITSYDINPSKTQAKGVIELKRFLEYAQTRGQYSMNNGDFSNEFTEYLYDKLVSYGYNVKQNVGCIENVIDLAVVDPNNENRYIVGIECDSGTYASIDSTIDRERIRKNILKNLGWKIYHIWSCDYYRNPKVEFEKLLNYIDSVKENKEEEIVVSDIIIKRKQKKTIKEDDSYIKYKAYQSHKRRATILDEPETLKALIEGIILIEAPIHINLIKKRVLVLTALTKLSEKAKRIFEQSINLIDYEKYEEKNNFFYVKNQDIMIRDRSELEVSYRKLEYISDEEIEKAVFYSIDRGLASNFEEVKTEVAGLFKISKSDKLSLRIKEEIEKLLNNNIIEVEEEMYYINDNNLANQKL